MLLECLPLSFSKVFYVGRRTVRMLTCFFGTAASLPWLVSLGMQERRVRWCK
jgi:hypothetical protein